MKIGVFDSGLGGLLILKQFLRVLPQYDYLYVGDNANVPYGDKTSPEIYELTQKAVAYLFENECGLIILACNTATATTLRKLQQEYLPQRYPSRRILGIIRPVIEEVVKRDYSRAGVLATQATVNSRSFAKELKKFAKNTQIFQMACPRLVPFIEKGLDDTSEIQRLLTSYIDPLIKQNIEALVLGCTHYEIFLKQIQSILGPKIKLFCEGQITAKKLKNYLVRHPEISNRLSQHKSRHYFITKLTDKYLKLMQVFLSDNLLNSDVVHQVKF